MIWLVSRLTHWVREKLVNLHASFDAEFVAHNENVEFPYEEDFDPLFSMLHECFDSEPDDDWNQLKKVPAEGLPSGWFWNCWTDGSGCLCAPDGARMYSYDLQPYHSTGGIEYRDPKNTRGNNWTIFWGTFAEFKEFVEEEILSRIF